MKAGEKVCLALDFPNRAEVLAAARLFSGRVGWVKIGLEAFTSEGPRLVGEVAAEGVRVFLDLKFHDIPATVERAVAAAARSGAAMINVHAFGGRAMLEAARRGAASSPGVKLIAVTLLTSLDAPALSDLPIAGHPEGIVRRLTLLARDCGLDGVVCAAPDLPVVRGACGAGFLAVVPGIRPAASPASDQKRVATAAQALVAGADILVVGRPVTAAPNPDRALDDLLSEIESVS
jgi:orotidine-5'-phosphate decarboxylase